MTVIYKPLVRAQHGHGNLAMLTADRKIELEQMRAVRNQLFEMFVKHPSDFALPLEIKKLDDQIAALNEPKKGTALTDC